ncbi:hypothetical protein AOLI_G00330390 [Acnodon oligacanthus]
MSTQLSSISSCSTDDLLDKERTFSNPKVVPGEAGRRQRKLRRLALRRTESTIGRDEVQNESLEHSVTLSNQREKLRFTRYLGSVDFSHTFSSSLLTESVSCQQANCLLPSKCATAGPSTVLQPASWGSASGLLSKKRFIRKIKTGVKIFLSLLSRSPISDSGALFVLVVKQGRSCG